MKRYLIFSNQEEPIDVDTRTWAEEIFSEKMGEEDLTEDEIVIWEIEGTIKKYTLEVKHTWKQKKE